MQPFPHPVKLHINFDQDWPTGLRDIKVQKCGWWRQRMDGRPRWAFGSGELKGDFCDLPGVIIYFHGIKEEKERHRSHMFEPLHKNMRCPLEEICEVGLPPHIQATSSGSGKCEHTKQNVWSLYMNIWTPTKQNILIQPVSSIMYPTKTQLMFRYIIPSPFLSPGLETLVKNGKQITQKGQWLLTWLQACVFKTIRIFNGCEVMIENFVTKVTVWHHEACQVMPNSYPEWWNFQFALNSHYRFIFLHTLPLTTAFRLEFVLFFFLMFKQK